MSKLGANSFINSIASNFGLAGNKADVIKDYVPAVAFTLYDGYYIYSPYENTNYLSDGSGNPIDKNGKIFHGLKPYIYYSARYKVSSSTDFVITYSLDNFITIEGMVSGTYVNDSGYVIDYSQCSNDGTSYRGATINQETLKEYYATEYPYTDINISGSTRRCFYDNKGTLDVSDDEVYYYINGNKQTYLTGNAATTVYNAGMQKVLEYEYYKDNGTKYYYDSDQKVIFYILNGKRLIQYKGQAATDIYNSKIVNNRSAIEYYKSAKEFTNRLISYGITNIKANQAYTEDGTQMFPGQTYKIFSESGDFKNVEYSNSTFNQQRLAVIRYVIETNLSTAISGFKQYSQATVDYRLPKIKENEWDIILNHVSVISFLQGLNIGTKEYNGYTIVVNNKNKEVVSEESIYINTNDGTNKKYHRLNDKDLLNSSNIVSGSLAIDYVRNSYNNIVTNEVIYFSPRYELGCYRSIVNQFDVLAYDDVYRYMDGKSASLQSAYFTALGRERYTMYRIGQSVTG